MSKTGAKLSPQEMNLIILIYLIITLEQCCVLAVVYQSTHLTVLQRTFRGFLIRSIKNQPKLQFLFYMQV